MLCPNEIQKIPTGTLEQNKWWIKIQSHISLVAYFQSSNQVGKLSCYIWHSAAQYCKLKKCDGEKHSRIYNPDEKFLPDLTLQPPLRLSVSPCCCLSCCFDLDETQQMWSVFTDSETRTKFIWGRSRVTVYLSECCPRSIRKLCHFVSWTHT